MTLQHTITPASSSSSSRRADMNMNIKPFTVQKARDRKKEHDRVDLLWFFEKKIMEKKFEFSFQV